MRSTETPQDDAQATYAPRLTKADGLIDWSQPADHLHNQIRGLTPWPHAYTFLDGIRYILHGSHVGALPPEPARARDDRRGVARTRACSSRAATARSSSSWPCNSRASAC